MIYLFITQRSVITVSPNDGERDGTANQVDVGPRTFLPELNESRKTKLKNRAAKAGPPDLHPQTKKQESQKL